MKTLMAECYTLLFKLTRAKLFSYWFGLFYITMLCFWIINGFSKLTVGWLGFAGTIQKLFKFPFYIVTAGLIFGVIYKFAPDMKSLAKEAKKKWNYATLILFSVSVVLLIIYMKFGDSIFD